MDAITKYLDHLTIEPELFGRKITALIAAGSEKERITKNDLRLMVSDNSRKGNYDLEELLKGGTPLFDACIALSTKPLIHASHNGGDEEDLNELVPKLADAVFIIYFYLLTQAKYLSDGDTGSKFIKDVLGRKGKPSEYRKLLASFDLEKMPSTWIRFVKPKKLSVLSTNRLALGVAGYRLPSAVIYGIASTEPYILDLLKNSSIFTTEEDVLKLIPIALKAQGYLRKWVENGLQWYAHPLTRSAAFLTKFKSFNHVCSDLLLFLYSKGQLDFLVNQKVLFKLPAEFVNFRTWTTWDDNTFNFTDEKIFN